MAHNRSFGSKHVTLGEDTKGMDLTAYGDTTGKKLFWDASADQLNIVGTLAMTGAPTITGNTTMTGTLGITAAASASTQPLTVTATSASTSGSSSVESMLVSTTLTGAGGVGGRARFALAANAALGGWANALKAVTTFGSTGAVTGLGSALCAELALSAGTTAGTYAPIEAEIVMAETAKSGVATSFLFANVGGHATGITEFLHNGYLFELGETCTIDTSHIVAASAVTDINSTHAIRIRVAGTTLYIPAHTAANFGG